MSAVFSVADTLSKTTKLLIFILICLILYCSFITLHLPSAYLPLYNQVHNVTTTWTGVIIGAGPLSITLACLLSVFLLNRFSNRMLFVVPTVLLGLATMLNSLLDFIPASEYYEGLSFALRFLQGIGKGLIEAASFAALVAIYPDKLATVTAIGEAILNGGIAAGPFVGSILYAVGGYKLAFFVPGLVIFLFAIPECFLPQLTTNIKFNNRQSISIMLDPWILFAAWHCTATQIMLTYHIPILSPHVQEALGGDVVWTGFALLLSSASICLSAPLLGYLIDRFNPYVFFVASSIFLPIVYAFIGPFPLLPFVNPSKPQVLITLALLGFFVIMGCIPSLVIMFDIYKAKHGGEIPSSVANVLVSLYCASFPLGSFLAITTSGIVAEHVSFRWSTGVLACIFFLETVACALFCLAVYRMKRTWKLKSNLFNIKQKGDNDTVIKNDITV